MVTPNQRYRVIVVLLFMMLSVSSLLAQNLITNGEFETSGGYVSEYERIYGANGVGAGQYAIDNTTANHGGGAGWPQPDNSSGRFMIVNGFGGNTNPTKIVWTTQQPVAVTANTSYTFSCRVVNLNLSVNGQIYPAKLQLKINGVAVGSENQLPTNNNWQDWTVSWNSQNSTQAVIAIYDVFTGNSGFGDDYALDGMSFVSDVTYSVTANNDTDISVCQDVSVDIDVLANDVIMPDASDVMVEVVAGPLHGEYEVLPNNTIRYTFTGGIYSTDQIKYRVSTHSVSAEAWVYVNLNRAPDVDSFVAPDVICDGEDLNVSVPDFSGDGTGVWEICQIQDGEYQLFDIHNVSISYNDWYLHYKVSNECGDGYSDAIQIHISEAPEISNIATPEAICAGDSFSLTTPTIYDHGTSIINQGWQIASTQTGDYSAFDNNNVLYFNDGYWIRYFAENDCGVTYGEPVQITVYSTEPVFDTISACDTYVWNGVTCNHSDDFQTTVQSPNGCDIAAHLHFVLSDAYTETQTYSSCGTFTWNKNGQVYADSGTYEYMVESSNPLVCDSIFTLNLTVNNAPEVLEGIAAPISICAGSTLNVSVPQYEMNHVDGGDAHWEYATSVDGPFTAFNPNTINWTYGTYYIRFAIVNDCDEDHSNVVSFNVDDVPVAHIQLSTLQVCEGQMLDLPEVDVSWNNEDESDRLAQWQMAPSENGEYTAISPTMTMQTSYDGNWIRFVAHNACGDDIVGPVRITVIAEAEEWLETITECDTYTTPSGDVITESQVIDYETYDPCYHVIHQPIVINRSDQVTEPITSCQESYVWHGMTFHHATETQYATVTLNNASGCDSIVNLQLDFGDYSTFTHDRTSCGSYVWEMNPDHVYTQSVRDSVFVAATNDAECDTWYYLNLTLGHDTLVEGGRLTECSGFVWHGVPYYEDAILYDSLQTSNTRCDSIVAYQLHIIAPVATDTNIVACNPISWQEHYCQTEGDYQHVFQSVYGCDSLVTVHFSLSEQLNYEYDTLVCEPFQWYEYQCNTDGMTCTHLFQTSQGCDSTVVMHVTMGEAVVTTYYIQACDYYEYDGLVYDEPGVVWFNVDTLETHSGCDSIVQIRLEIKDSEAIGDIHGNSVVYVASNLVSGIYRYEIDTVDVVGSITWSLTNPQWHILDAAENYCRIFVTTPGSTTLKARFLAAECGEMERSFEIYADYFGEEELEERKVRVYPNPSQGTITVEAEGIESIRLIDMLGQTLETIDCSHADSVTLNFNRYAPSIYLLEIKTDSGVIKKRVILCR